MLCSSRRTPSTDTCFRATGGGIDPSRETVSNIARVAVGSDAAFEPIVNVAAGVVDPRGDVVLDSFVRRVVVLRFRESLEISITCRLAGRLRAENTVVDHLVDLRLGAGRLGGPRVAGARPGVVLKEAGVGDGADGGLDADAALGLLHHGGEDETGIEFGARGGRLDCRLEVGVVRVRVGGYAHVGASFVDERQIGSPHGVEA